MHELAYTHPLAGVDLRPCATCEHGEPCCQVNRALSEPIARRGGWMADGQPCPRYLPENREEAQ